MTLLLHFVSGLSHLIGSSLLRAYMHGFFMDIRLYHKVWCWLFVCSESVQVFTLLLTFSVSLLQVKSMVNPFAYEEYRKDKIRQKIEEARTQRVQIKVRDRDRDHLHVTPSSCRLGLKPYFKSFQHCLSNLISKHLSHSLLSILLLFFCLLLHITSRLTVSVYKQKLYRKNCNCLYF